MGIYYFVEGGVHSNMGAQLLIVIQEKHFFLLQLLGFF